MTPVVFLEVQHCYIGPPARPLVQRSPHDDGVILAVSGWSYVSNVHRPEIFSTGRHRKLV